MEKQTSPVMPFFITVVLILLFVGVGMVLSRNITLPDLFSAFRSSPWSRMHNRYHELSRRGEYETALEAIREALAHARENEGERSRRTCISLTDLTECLMNLDRYEEAVAAGEEALELAEAVYTDYRYMVVRCLQNLGECYFYMDDYMTAEDWFLRAREALDTYDADTDDKAQVLDWLSAVFEAQDRWGEAVPLYEQVIQLYADSASFIGEITEARVNMAVAYAKDGDLDASEQAFADALAAVEKYRGKQSEEYGGVLLDMADLYVETGRPDGARELYRKSIDLLKGFPGAMFPSAASAMDRLADFHGELGQTEEVIGIYREMLAWYEDSYGEMNNETVYPHYRLGEALEAAGRTAEALSHYRRAVDIADSATDADDTERSFAYRTLSEALDRAGETQQAEVYKARAEALEVSD